jgi:serine/threonine protein kinase
VLDGMLAGLEAMHGVGIAHLDVKPSNVILRGNTGDAVLVDFGLAGRKLRPGCATLCYGAPEIWDSSVSSVAELPATAADVYALGACAFELVTGKTLFDGSSDVAIISQHMTHDGLPPAIAALGETLPVLQNFLGAALRQSPHARASVAELRAAFPAVRDELARRPWPIGAAAR